MFGRTRPKLACGNGSLAHPVTDLFNLGTSSTAVKWAQRCVGVDALSQLYSSACEMQVGAEAIFAPLLRLLNVSWNLSLLDRQRIPTSSGAIVVANHPFGLIEGVVLGALLEQVRPDVRIMANLLLGHFPQVAKSVILVDPFGGETSTRANRRGLREALGWLKSGGILGVFPAGEVASVDVKRKRVADPRWSSSIARLASLANCPGSAFVFCRAQWVYISDRRIDARTIAHRIACAGVLEQSRQDLGDPGGAISSRSEGYRSSPLTKRASSIFGGRPTFWRIGRTEKPAAFSYFAEREVSAESTGRAGSRRRTGGSSADRTRDRQSALLDEQGEHSVYIGDANRLPNVVREIGRLRELTFRKAGEGTGRETDLDEFDSYYLHLFVWSRSNKELVGAYRVGQTDLILKNVGLHGFYTNTLFDYGRRFLERVSPAVELGRSFVRLEYQKSYMPLLLLWRGICAFICKNPRYKILFGPVSISNDYHPGSKQLIVSFLKEYCRAADLARLVRARSPFRSRPLKKWDSETSTGPVWDIEELSALVADIETDQKGVPILLKQYLKLGGRLVSFNVDPEFSNALDGLIVVDLLKTERRLLERYLGKEGTIEYLSFHESQLARMR